jgi:hypothetical protein
MLDHPVRAELLHYPPGAHTWKAGPRIPAVQKLGSPMTAAVAMAPGSPSSSKQASGVTLPANLGPPHLQKLSCLLETHAPMQVDSRASAACGHETIQAHQLCYDTSTFNLLLSAKSLLLYTQVYPRLQVLLFCWHQEAFLPTEHGALSTVPNSKRAHASTSRARIPDSLLRRGKM